MESKSISDRLRAAGYSHERLPESEATGKHCVRRVSDGQYIGDLDAFEAAAFLEGLLIPH